MKRESSEHIVKRVEATQVSGERVTRFLEEIDHEAVCSGCGGLPYDIVFTHRGVQYKFCLYKIQRGDVILAETDYEKLYEYTRKDGPMMLERHSKKAGAPAGI